MTQDFRKANSTDVDVFTKCTWEKFVVANSIDSGTKIGYCEASNRTELGQCQKTPR